GTVGTVRGHGFPGPAATVGPDTQPITLTGRGSTVFNRGTPVVGAVVARRASTRVQGDLTRFRQALLDQALQSRTPVYLIHACDPRVDRYYRDGRRGPYLW